MNNSKKNPENKSVSKFYLRLWKTFTFYLTDDVLIDWGKD